MAFLQRVDVATYAARQHSYDPVLTGAITHPDARVRYHLLTQYTYDPTLTALAQAWRPDPPRPPREGLSLMGQAWAQRPQRRAL